MPALKPIIAPFSSCFIGNYGDSAVLTRISSFRTQGATIREEMPTSNALRCLDYNVIQSDNWTIRVTLSFLKDNDDMVVRLCRGLTISQDINSPIATNQYQLLLIAPDETTKDSYYFPRVRTEKVREVSYSKTAPSVIQLTFIGEERNVNNPIVYVNTPAALATVMGSVSPI